MSFLSSIPALRCVFCCCLYGRWSTQWMSHSSQISPLRALFHESPLTLGCEVVGNCCCLGGMGFILTASLFYLFERHNYRKRERQKELPSTNGHNSQARTRLKAEPGAHAGSPTWLKRPKMFWKVFILPLLISESFVGYSIWIDSCYFLLGLALSPFSPNL